MDNNQKILESLRWYFFARHVAAYNISEVSKDNNIKQYWLTKSKHYINVMNEITTLANNGDFLDDFNDYFERFSKDPDDCSPPDENKILQHEIESIE